MTSPAAFLSDMNTLVTGTTPPSPVTPAYSLIDTFIEERGAGQHREFVWSIPTAARVTDEGLQRNREWDCIMTLFVHRLDATWDAYLAAIANEINAIRDAFDNKSSWSSGVLDPVLDDVVTEDVEMGESSSPRSGGLHERTTVRRIDFPFRVLIQG